MQGQIFLLLCVFVPLLGAFLLPLIARFNYMIRNIMAMLLPLVSFVFSFLLLPIVLRGEEILLNVDLPLGLSFGFAAQPLSVFMALTAALVMLIIVFYSFGINDDSEEDEAAARHKNSLCFFSVLFLGGMMGMLYSTNLIFLYIFLNIVLICSWILIGLYHANITGMKADKAFLIMIGASFLMLIGFISVYTQTGTFDMSQLQGKGVDTWVIILILLGIFAMSAIVPVHSWLPDAGAASASVYTLLHSVLCVICGVYLYSRLFLSCLQMEPVWQLVIPIVAGSSAVISAGTAIVEHNIKRIAAYSTISQVSFLFFGLSCGIQMGIAGGLLYAFMIALSIAGFMLCIGVVEKNTGETDIRKLGGLTKNMPITAIAFAICVFSFMGIPPFSGFFAKYMIISGAMQTGYVWLPVIGIVAMLLTVVYSLRLFFQLFFGEQTHLDAREGSWEMVLSAAAFAFLSLGFSFFINFPSANVSYIVESFGRW